jgi:hypothetical protein
MDVICIRSYCVSSYNKISYQLSHFWQEKERSKSSLEDICFVKGPTVDATNAPQP